MDKYERLEKIGHGTYGVVYSGRGTIIKLDKTDGTMVALKKIKP